MKDLKVGVVGCGNHAQTHFKEAAGEPRLHLSAIAESEPEQLERAKAEHRPERAFQDYREMVEAVDLDLVSLKRDELFRLGLSESMVTGDFPIPENMDDAPDALRSITPYLDLTEVPGSDLIRVGMKVREDIEWAQRAADESDERPTSADSGVH